LIVYGQYYSGQLDESGQLQTDRANRLDGQTLLIDDSGQYEQNFGGLNVTKTLLVKCSARKNTV